MQHIDLTFNKYKKKVFCLACIVIVLIINSCLVIETRNSPYNQTLVSNQSNYSEAIVNFSKIIEKNPRDEKAYYYRGKAWFALTRFKNAINDYTRALAIRPTSSIYYDRGIAWFKMHQFECAIADYTSAIKIGPTYSEAYNNRGVVYDEMGEFEKAIEDYTKAIELRIDVPSYYYNRGNSWKAKGDYEKAMNDYNKAIELDPHYFGAYNNRGNLLRENKKYEEALKDFNHAIKLNPDCVEFIYNRGLNYTEQKEWQKAIIDFKEAIEKDNKFTKAYNSLAWILATCPEDNCRNGKEAIKYADYLLEIEKSFITLDTAAAAYAENADFDIAISIQKQAISELQSNTHIERKKYYWNLLEEHLISYSKQKPWRQQSIIEISP